MMGNEAGAEHVTVVFTTYNRGAELISSIGRLLAQTRVPDAIWVIDDASTDGTQQLMSREFPWIRYTRLPQNVGVIRARNVALSGISTGYLLLLDDDSWFEEPDGLARTVAFARNNPDGWIIALNVRTMDGQYNSPLPDVPHFVRSFQGCAVLFNMASLSQHKLLFEAAFDRQGEEKEMCLRAYDLGLSVCAVPDIVVFHAVSNAGRNWAKIRFYEQRNDILRELILCPARMLILRLPRTWAAHTVHNLRHGFLLADLRVLLSLPWILLHAIKLRAPVSVRTYSFWTSLSSKRRIRVCASEVAETT
jgi:GT2 family glycosyltransferase